MDYLNIYKKFITSRRELEANLIASNEYIEIHHIVPRSLGGSNCSSNLISLSAEDHYFAHLLLAKIFDGGMWSAVFLMSGKRGKTNIIVGQRSMYGFARRKWSENQRGKDGLKGSDNGNYNEEKLKWHNVDTNQIESATRHEMFIKFGGTRATWTSVASKHRKTYRGWTLLGTEIKLRSNKNKSHKFVNRDGRKFEGTQSEFIKHTGINAASASRVCRHRDITKCGWRHNDTEDRDYKYKKEDGTPGKLNRGNTFVLEDCNGRIIKGTRHELAAFFDKSPAVVSASLYYAKKGNKMYGYKLKEII